jgi:hypothetical protein
MPIYLGVLIKGLTNVIGLLNELSNGFRVVTPVTTRNPLPQEWQRYTDVITTHEAIQAIAN